MNSARVPAVGPAVAEAALRPAVDEEGDRQLAGRIAGFSVQPQTRVVVGAGEAELLEGDRVELGEQRRG